MALISSSGQGEEDSVFSVGNRAHHTHVLEYISLMVVVGWLRMDRLAHAKLHV